MEIYRSKYAQLAFFEENKLLELTWFAETENMKDEEYQQEFLNFLDKMFEFKPKKMIPDTRNFFFSIHPELQDWMNEKIFVDMLAIGIKEIAFAVSSEMIAQLSIEQTMEEQEGAKFVIRYFDSKEAAKAWILSV